MEILRPVCYKTRPRYLYLMPHKEILFYKEILNASIQIFQELFLRVPSLSESVRVRRTSNNEGLGLYVNVYNTPVVFGVVYSHRRLQNLEFPSTPFLIWYFSCSKRHVNILNYSNKNLMFRNLMFRRPKAHTRHDEDCKTEIYQSQSEPIRRYLVVNCRGLMREINPGSFTTT